MEQKLLLLLERYIILLEDYEFKFQYEPKNKIFCASEKKNKKETVKISTKVQKKKIERNILAQDFYKNKEYYQNILSSIGLNCNDIDVIISRSKSKDNIILYDFLISRQTEILTNSRPVII